MGGRRRPLGRRFLFARLQCPGVAVNPGFRFHGDVTGYKAKKDPHMAGLFMKTASAYLPFMISFFLLSYSFSVMMPDL